MKTRELFSSQVQPGQVLNYLALVKIKKNIYISDGADNGTIELGKIFNSYKHARIEEKYVIPFERFDSDNQREYGFFVSDGTPKGTIEVFLPAHKNLIPSYATSFKGKVFFAGQDSNKGNELWITDGTVEGTKLLKDIKPGSDSSSPMHLSVIDNILYFSANQVLWKSDGTTDGTTIVSSNLKTPRQIKKFGDKIVMSANASSSFYNNEPVIYDPLNNSFNIIKDINSSSTSSSPIIHVTKNGDQLGLLIEAKPNDFGRRVFISNGDQNNLTKINTPETGIYKFYPTKLGLFAVKGRTGSSPNQTLWDFFDTTQIQQYSYQGAYSDYFPSDITELNGEIYLSANRTNREFYKLKGTELELVKEINEESSASIYGIIKVNDKLLISASTKKYGRELWISDGTEEGTRLFKDFTKEGSSDLNLNLTNLELR